MQVCAFQKMAGLSLALASVLTLGVVVAPAAAQSAPTRRPTRPPVAVAKQATPAAKATTSKATAPKATPPKAVAAKPAATATKPATTTYSASASRARAARIAKARADARARETREIQTPRFKLDDLGQEVPDVRAEAAIIYNPETQEVLWESNARDQRSIASITKVMTALVFFESGLPLDTPVTVLSTDVFRASTTYLRAGYKVTANDLIHALLIGSDNAAARALARISPAGATGFIDQMNDKAIELGLDNTHYADPSGLLAANVSSAFDMARLIAFAGADDRIGPIMRKASHAFKIGKATINVNSTNQLVKTGEYDVVGGKTGFISRSGYCLASLLRLPQSGQQVAVVVLGAKSNQGRFWETRHLFNWLSGHAQKVLGIGQTTPPQPQPQTQH